MSSGTPFLVQETYKGAAGKHIGAMQPRNRAMEQPLADKRAGQHGWELSEDPDFEMQNGHVPSMEPNCHGYDTVPHGRKLAVGNHMGEIDRHDIKRSSSHGSPTLRV